MTRDGRNTVRGRPLAHPTQTPITLALGGCQGATVGRLDTASGDDGAASEDDGAASEDGGTRAMTGNKP